ncbi:MAG: hypothetical protein AAB487_01220 [Patescibacteria group bacterium]
MRVNLKSRKLILSGTVLAAFIINLFTFKAAQAQNINFSQAILPVRFVYLDQGREIKDIWSNITETDGQYMIKFFDSKLKTEISASDKIFSDYQKIISLNAGEISSKKSLTIDFVKNNGLLEEVRTYT